MRKREPNKIHSEDEFLAHKAKVALKALKATLGSMVSSASGSLKVSHWTEEHPWQTTGAALVLGFTLAAPFSEPKPDTGQTSVPDPAGLTQVQIWATLLDTGADILKAVLTPYLQQTLMGPKQS
ncbi:MAG: hypothetical protein R3257_04030 [bacterium]|nr:hypothetical protein [bacterium]